MLIAKSLTLDGPVSWLQCIWPQSVSLKFCWLDNCFSLQWDDSLKDNKRCMNSKGLRKTLTSQNNWLQGYKAHETINILLGHVLITLTFIQASILKTDMKIWHMSDFNFGKLLHKQTNNMPVMISIRLMLVGVFLSKNVTFSSVFLHSTSRSLLPHQSHLLLFGSSPFTYPATAKTNLKPASTASINMFQGMVWNFWHTICPCSKEKFKYCLMYFF